MGICLANLDYLPIPVPEETLEERVARRAGTVFAQFLVWVFSPSPPGRPSGSPGVGVFPFALEVTIRTGVHLITLRHSRPAHLYVCLNLAQVASRC